MQKKLSKILPSRPFRFRRYGRAYHLLIEDVKDLEHVLELDEGHWVATTAPINTINIDLMFLDLLDDDDDGRVRASEVKKAISWLFSVLTDTSGITNGNLTLQLDAINSETPDGKSIFDSAKEVLSRIDREDEPEVKLDQVRRIRLKEKLGGLDKAGIVLVEAADHATTEQFLKDIIACTGGAMHPSGKRGVDQKQLDEFFKVTTKYIAWYEQGELASEKATSDIMPLGKDTPEAFRLYSQLYTKLNQFFALCELLQLNPNAEEQLSLYSRELTDINIMATDEINNLLEESPLSLPNQEGILMLDNISNPMFDERMEKFRLLAINRILGKKIRQLNQFQWRKIKSAFESHQKWLAEKPDSEMDKISIDTLRSYIAEDSYRDTVRYLIEGSHRTAYALSNLQMVEKLILYQANIISFVNSFVSFPELYNPDTRALFEMGTLIMDGRHFSMAVKVPDRKKHIIPSSRSNMFIMYVEISSKEGGKLYEVAVPVTAGNRGNLHIGKWGIFRDVYNVERHAMIAEIVENPISLREAIIAPFIRLGHAISGKLEDITSQAEKKLESKGSQVVTDVHKAADQPPAQPKKTNQNAQGGLLAGGGIAVAALGSSLAFITKTLSSMTLMDIFGGLLAALLAVILPATISAYLKLSRRDLSAILEGAGWGINARMRLSHLQSRTFTYHPSYPLGSRGIAHRSWWFIIIVTLAVLAGVYWVLSRYGIIPWQLF